MPKVAIDCTILENRAITKDVSEIIVDAPKIARQASPGQFIHIKITPGEPLLRRPLSLADADEKSGTLRLVYRIAGKGTAALAALKEGAGINCLGPLGHGFDLDCRRPLLIGGGMGIAPLIFLARRLKEQDTDTAVLLGGRGKEEMFWPPLFEKYAGKVFITTDDGSVGEKGFTVDLLPQLLEENSYDRIFVCGPQPMMAAAAKIAAAAQVPCQVSLEKHMACGIGACLSCTCEAKDGGKRKKVCADGPVFWAEEVL